MYTVTYYRLGSSWFLDLPEYLEKGDADDLERIGSFKDFLDLVAGTRDCVTFHMDINPFEGADILTLVASSGNESGAYYYIERLGGQRIDLELWFNSVIYSGQERLPENIYIRKIR